MAEREHKRSHMGSKIRREEVTMNKRKSPLGEHDGQEEEPVKGPEGEKTFRV